jgi:hypothetical protein
MGDNHEYGADSGSNQSSTVDLITRKDEGKTLKNLILQNRYVQVCISCIMFNNQPILHNRQN